MQIYKFFIFLYFNILIFLLKYRYTFIHQLIQYISNSEFILYQKMRLELFGILYLIYFLKHISIHFK